MATATEVPVSSTPPTQQLGVLEVDAFCAGCHYNLHGQLVTLDDRLAIPVCRCPECGRFHPAGAGVAASSVWLRRLASLLLFVWVCLVLVLTFAWLLAMGGVSTASIEQFTTFEWVGPNGKPVEQKIVNGNFSWVEVGTNNIVTGPMQTIFKLRPIFDWSNPRALEAFFIFSTISVFMGFIIGVVVVTLLWHWPRWRYLWCLLLPAAPAMFFGLIYGQSNQYELIRRAILARLVGQMGLQCAGVLLGILVGRKVSRTLVRLFVPPKPRQYLAFLWQVDGKTLRAS